MKKIFYLCGFAFALIATSCGGNSQAADTDSTGVENVVVAKVNGNSYTITDEGLKSTNGLPLLVDFSATWCPPCQKLKPIFHELGEQYKDKVNFVSIDTDDMPALAQRYGIESIPCLIYMTPEGKILDRSVGFVDASFIKSALNKHFGV